MANSIQWWMSYYRMKLITLQRCTHFSIEYAKVNCELLMFSKI